MASIASSPERINHFFDPLIRYAQMLGHAAPRGWKAVTDSASKTQPVLVAIIGAEFVAPRAIELVGSAQVSGIFEASPPQKAPRTTKKGGRGLAQANADPPPKTPRTAKKGPGGQRATLLADVEAVLESSPVVSNRRRIQVQSAQKQHTRPVYDLASPGGQCKRSALGGGAAGVGSDGSGGSGSTSLDVSDDDDDDDGMMLPDNSDTGFRVSVAGSKYSPVKPAFTIDASAAAGMALDSEDVLIDLPRTSTLGRFDRAKGPARRTPLFLRLFNGYLA